MSQICLKTGHTVENSSRFNVFCRKKCCSGTFVDPNLTPAAKKPVPMSHFSLAAASPRGLGTAVAGNHQLHKIALFKNPPRRPHILSGPASHA